MGKRYQMLVSVFISNLQNGTEIDEKIWLMEIWWSAFVAFEFSDENFYERFFKRKANYYY